MVLYRNLVLHMCLLHAHIFLFIKTTERADALIYRCRNLRVIMSKPMSYNEVYSLIISFRFNWCLIYNM